MRIVCIISLIIVSLISCKEEEKIPADILDEAQMIDVLVEMELAQATMKFEMITDMAKPNYKGKFSEVYQKFDISEEQFHLNLDYYCAEPLKMKNLYENVIVELSERQANITSSIQEKKALQVEE